MGCNCGDGLAALSGHMENMQAMLGRFLAAHAAPAEQYEQTMARQAVSTADANGAAIFNLGPTFGKVWYVEIITKHSPTNTTILEILVGPKGITDPAYRRAYSPASTDDAASGLPAIFVGQGEHLVLHWTGATSGDTLTAALQIRVHRVGAQALPARL